MQIKNKGNTSQTISVRAVSYTLLPNANLVLPDADLVAARRAIRDFPALEITNANDMSGALSNLTAISDPTVESDVDLGYSIGSKWLNISTQEEFTCFSATNGAAVWKKTGSGSGGAGLSTGSTLPTANESKRGQQFLLLGAALTPDTLYICTKDYQDNYVWNEIVLIS